MKRELDGQQEQEITNKYYAALDNYKYKSARKLNYNIYEIIFKKYKQAVRDNNQLRIADACGDLNSLLRDGCALVNLQFRRGQK